MAEDKKSDDLTALVIDATTDWGDPAQAFSSIQTLHGKLLAKVEDAVGWYRCKRRGYRVWAKGLRGLATVLVVFGGLVPFLVLLGSGDDAPLKAVSINPNLGYLLFALAGGLLAINRYLGISSAWIRYIGTALKLEQAQEQFQLDWIQKLAAMGGEPKGTKDVEALVAELRSFLDRINTIIHTETQTWAHEFERDLGLLEKAASNADAKTKPGAR